MPVKVRIPTPLRKLTADQSSVSSSGATVAELIDSLDADHPGIKARICDDAGELRQFVNVFVNGEDVRYMDGLGSAVADGDEVSIVPAVAGGQ